MSDREYLSINDKASSSYSGTLTSPAWSLKLFGNFQRYPLQGAFRLPSQSPGQHADALTRFVFELEIERVGDEEEQI
jgi:hypothetical protein